MEKTASNLVLVRQQNYNIIMVADSTSASHIPCLLTQAIKIIAILNFARFSGKGHHVLH